MAELATIARPYADALFKAAGPQAAALTDQMSVLAAVAGNAELRQFADNPRVAAADVYQVLARAAGTALEPKVANLLQAVVDNGRLAALAEIAEQFKAHVNAQSGTSDAVIHSAYPIEGAALADVVATLEQRFGRRLNPSVVLDPELIGGIRVVVGDEVLDTSVRARLEQMKVALTA